MSGNDVQSRIDIEVRSTGVEQATVALDKLVGAENAVVVSIDKSTRIRERNEAAVERLARRYDQEYRFMQQAARAQRDLDQARASGLAGTVAYERALAGLQKQQADLSRGVNDNTRALDAHGKSVGLARHEWINLSRQFQDVGVSLAGGQNPLTVLLQQGSQIGDVFSSSGAGAGAALRSFGGTALRFALNPLTLLAAGLGVAGYAAYQFADQQRVLERSLNGTGRAAGVTADRLRELGVAGARSGGIGAGEGIGLAGQFASAGIAGANIKTLVGDALPFSRAFGLDLEKAGDEITQIVSESGLGAFEKRFGAVSFSTKEMIRSLEASGRYIEAQAEKTRLFDEEVKKAKDSSSELEKVWRSIRNWATTPVFGLGSALNRAANGPSLQEQLASARGEFFNLRAQRRGDASSYPGEMAAEARVRELEQRIQQERDKTAQAAREADLNRRSQLAGPIIDSLSLDSTRLRGLKEQLDAVKPLTDSAEGLAKLGNRASDAKETVDRLTYGITHFQTTVEKMREDTALAVAEISARTFAEREAVTMERARVATLRETHSVTQAAVAAESERAKLLAESARKVDDLARTSRNTLTLAPLTPFERRMKEIDIAERDFRRENIPNAATPMAREFDTAAISARNLTGAFDGLAAKIGGGSPASNVVNFTPRGISSAADPRGLSAYIQERAGAYGIDPNIALRVARSEGLAKFSGDNGTSFGAMQLHVGGGIGDEFRRATGLDPSNPANEKATIDYALKIAAQRGWRPWHGAARVGIGEFEGIGGRPANDNSLSTRAAGAFDDQRAAARYEFIDAKIKELNVSLGDQTRLIEAQHESLWKATRGSSRSTSRARSSH